MILNKPEDIRPEGSRRSSSTSGFKLLLGDVCETVSVHSRQSCKQKIDSMFDDSRSGMGRHLLNNPLEEEEEPRISNCVQAKIERMFSDVVISSEDKNRELNGNGNNEFSVRFLGVVALPNKITNLEGLQEPLHKLYAGADQAKKCILDICPTGLRVREIGTKEMQISQFSNITVWSAVKYVMDVVNNTSAFLPLITDPDNLNKRKLFRPIIGNRSSSKPEPMFVVVMKTNTDSNKLLECHGFLCRTSEDSIVIAATLYRSLVSHMTNKSRRSEDVINRSPKPFAGIERKFNRSFKMNGMSKKNRKLDKEPIASSSKPVRPPRKKRPAPLRPSGEYCTPVDAVNKKRSSFSNAQRENEHGNCDMDYSSIDYSAQQVRGQISRDKQRNNNFDFTNSGDVFTKVAIPRSTSFLNAGGMACYKGLNQRRPHLVTGSGGSPLGFSELFAEFRLQENLHSLDEILGVIINADGMSFNDLKPIYKEFLLKLAVTLTKDEMFNRSKSIMRKQKKKKIKQTISPNLRYFVDDKYGGQHIGAYKLRNTKPDIENLFKKTSNEDMHQNRNSSSGYVSCSECSYDSESCTCASAEPCYCSLGYNASIKNCHKSRTHSSGKNISYNCDCDSDSCLDVDTKCYCKKINEQNLTRCSENALNVKKSEEIAALFADFKPGPGIEHVNPNKSKRRSSYDPQPNLIQVSTTKLTRSWQSNVSLVDTLGYFP